jgi:hypothetical protein
MRVYSHDDQLEFLSFLTFVEANKVLIRATVLYLERIVSKAERRRALGKTILRMVAVLGWQGLYDVRQEVDPLCAGHRGRSAIHHSSHSPMITRRPPHVTAPRRPTSLTAAAQLGLGPDCPNQLSAIHVEDIFNNPELLKGKLPADIDQLIGNSPGWEVEALCRGAHEGRMGLA